MKIENIEIIFDNGGGITIQKKEILSAVNNPDGDEDISWGNVLDVINFLRAIK